MLMTDNRQLVKSHRDDTGKTGNFDLYEPPEGIDEIYVDGFSFAIAGPITTKLDFFSSQPARDNEDENVELREIKIRLVLPTFVIIDMCRKILDVYAGNKIHIDQALDEMKSVVNGSLPNYESSEEKK